jgi:hypothetical protein
MEIEDEKWVIECVRYFPNVTELSLCYYAKNDHCLPTILDRLMLLKQLTKLFINNYSGPFSEIMDLLYSIPNVHTFTFSAHGSFNNEDLILLEQSEIFQFISKNNKIKEINIISKCKLEYVKVFVNLCPRLEYIILKNSRNN